MNAVVKLASRFIHVYFTLVVAILLWCGVAFIIIRFIFIFFNMAFMTSSLLVLSSRVST